MAHRSSSKHSRNGPRDYANLPRLPPPPTSPLPTPPRLPSSSPTSTSRSRSHGDEQSSSTSSHFNSTPPGFSDDDFFRPGNTENHRNYWRDAEIPLSKEFGSYQMLLNRLEAMPKDGIERQKWVLNEYYTTKRYLGMLFWSRNFLCDHTKTISIEEPADLDTVKLKLDNNLYPGEDGKEFYDDMRRIFIGPSVRFNVCHTGLKTAESALKYLNMLMPAGR